MTSPYKRIDISDIVGIRAPRSGKAETEILSESIKQIGILHAPVVVADGGRFRLIAGASRLAAAKQAGQESVWALVLDTAANSPQAKLAFLDENLLRTELPQAMVDEQWHARKKLLEKLDPSTKPEAKKKAGGAHGAKGGRGKKKNPSAKSADGYPSKPPSDEPSARQQSLASHRVEGSAQGTWELYSDGKLTQSQVDALVTIKDQEKQEQVANQAAGKSVAETKTMVREVTSTEAQGERLKKALLKELGRIDGLCRDLVANCAHVGGLINALPPDAHLDAGAIHLNLKLAMSAVQDLLQRLLGGSSVENGSRLLLASSQP